MCKAVVNEDCQTGSRIENSNAPDPELFFDTVCADIQVIYILTFNFLSLKVDL